jgi:hypothetical protein
MIGPKIQRVRIEGVGTAAELGGPEPPFIVDETTGRRIYGSYASAASSFEHKAAKAAASAASSTSPSRPPTFRELAGECRKAASDRAAKAAARAAAAVASKPKP